MVNLRSKLKLTFNPCKIKPITINRLNLEIIIDKLKEFDKELVSMKDSMQNLLIGSMVDGTSNYMTYYDKDITLEMLLISTWNKTSYTILTTMREKILESLWPSIHASLMEKIKVEITNSMIDSMWASIMITLTKKEYEEELFKDKIILKGLPYEKVKKLCLLYDWFSRRGLFPHRSIIKNEYLLTPWMYPKIVATVKI